MTTPRIRTGLRIPYEQNTTLILISREMGISKNAVILQAIREFIERQKEAPKSDLLQNDKSNENRPADC